uniref:Uncharacterized protein n=1 Tax=Siphoviridae sp. ct2D011 TaxID=2825314 RepID=A0A8S5V9E5_9CAUD|nr:MAG TPA: hypothetical protein [Siphoviridae sp. ct2D011]
MKNNLTELVEYVELIKKEYQKKEGHIDMYLLFDSLNEEYKLYLLQGHTEVRYKRDIEDNYVIISVYDKDDRIYFKSFSNTSCNMAFEEFKQIVEKYI